MASKSTQVRLDGVNDMFKIVMSDGLKTVKAPLPDEIGVTVGSEYSTPFDTSDISQKLQNLLAISGVSRKIGIKMKKYYVNPELTEISFDLEFVAYYSTVEEVIVPIYTLMTMAVGRDAKWETISTTFRNAVTAIRDKAMEGADAVGAGDAIRTVVNSVPEFEISAPDGRIDAFEDGTNQALDLISIITGPIPITLSIGNVLELNDVYVSSVSPRFSNILDPNGLPLSATCSVTCVVREAPTSGSGNKNGNIESWFKGTR